MTNLYRYIFPVLDTLLRSDKDFHVSFGIILGVFLGMFPVGTLQWVLSLFAFILLRINLLTFLTTLFTAIPLALLLDPVWNSVGFRFLTNRSDLYPVWGWMHHAPIIPFTDFNNTIVLGVSIAAGLLAPALTVLFLLFSLRIRQTISRLWYQTKISRFYAHYRKY